MRLMEFVSEEEWRQLQQLVFNATWRALTMYQQQRATQQRIATKPAAALKPQAAKTAKALARKAKRPPHAAAPKSLPNPNPLPQAKAEVTQTYRPVKTATPLPPTTRMAVAKAKPAAPKPVPNKTAPPSITGLNHIDQATRRWLPPEKKGPNPIDLLSLDERG